MEHVKIPEEESSQGPRGERKGGNHPICVSALHIRTCSPLRSLSPPSTQQPACPPATEDSQSASPTAPPPPPPVRSDCRRLSPSTRSSRKFCCPSVKSNRQVKRAGRTCSVLFSTSMAAAPLQSDQHSRPASKLTALTRHRKIRRLPSLCNLLLTSQDRRAQPT